MLTSLADRDAQNEYHALAAASFMMDNDRRRKFQFSLTIEDTQATLWHHTRSHSTIAYSFDMNEVRAAPYHPEPSH